MRRRGVNNFLAHHHRRSLSTNNALTNYLQLLNKRLLFHCHPDFFVKWPRERAINAENLKTLSHVIGGGGGGSLGGNDKHRSLSMYLKPTDFDPQPRRTKVILGSRLPESLREILSDLEGELPDPPASEREKTNFSTAFNTQSNPEEVSRFLDSLIDRKDLIAWRIRRNQELGRVQDVVQASLGCSSIELRYSWSAQNNAVLFASLLSLVDSMGETRTLLTGLKLVLTADDSSLQPVDAVEAHVLLNPGHVPLQWKSALRAVTPRLLEEAAQARVQIDELQRLCEADLGKRLRDALFASRAAPSRLRDNQLRVKLLRGHTCSKRWYRQFLFSYAEICVPRQDTVDLATTNSTSSSPGSLLVIEAPSSASSSSVPTRASHWLAQLPLSCTVVVEEGHGTKMLPNGQFRVDCRATTHDIHALIERHALESVTATAADLQCAASIRQLVDSLSERLGLRSLEPGVGVRQDMMLEFLQRCDAFLRANMGNRGLLGSLVGLRVRVGKYLGLTDDGFVSLPFNISLLQEKKE